MLTLIGFNSEMSLGNVSAKFSLVFQTVFISSTLSPFAPSFIAAAAEHKPIGEIMKFPLLEDPNA